MDKGSISSQYEGLGRSLCLGKETGLDQTGWNGESQESKGALCECGKVGKSNLKGGENYVAYRC